MIHSFAGFFLIFLLRPICYQCPFKGLPRTDADITIADFWGVRKRYPGLDDKKGTSLLLAHSNKGLDLIKSNNDVFLLRECELETSLEVKPMMTLSTKPSPNRSRFFATFFNEGYSAAEKAIFQDSTGSLEKLPISSTAKKRNRS